MQLNLVASLPMYDWPEVREETNAQWERLRESLRSRGVTAPDHLARTNGDLPPVPGGILDEAGKVIASDPANLPADDLDLKGLWLHPGLFLAQACWGPLERGVADHVQIVGQPSYEGIEGGCGPFYSSAIIMRRDGQDILVSPDGIAQIPMSKLRGRRLAFNDLSSMSGLQALLSDLEAMGETIEIFSQRVQTGSHRQSIVAIAEGGADVAAIDCKTLLLAKRFEPAARDVQVVGWTKPRKGLPFITSRHTSAEVVALMRAVLAQLGLCVDPERNLPF
ncbi:PhnD/SsuA/transferrin family substrate-binding protein [Rhizobium sp. BK661]|uniref:phosphate/phosphite/phosphonate ABC transporter substrate-binding protein n=2 Tax=unclassified Rhizobium TaxID=2613769 RepID=UPI00179439A2|nr:PhnD/SsuA/transferrin family substrate-binding protein [Rhizobium sp. BK661]MBB3543528.1 ABC-type phosphate/phosphonate transport system substrate-binding protein [Rhizobium sp. BK399]MCS3742756.1 ABC-type phosphate/phosphonate transport system substrate-binding protein [Rhizobium sp. BK661]